MRFICSLVTALIITMSSALASPEIYINIPEYALRLVDNGQVIKTYSIAVGTPYEQTPTGNFQIFSKQEYPTWFPGSNFTDRTPVPPGPDNPLGTCWMEFTPNYGIHGTNKGWDISYPVSGGCIRMQDADARELYDKVPLGTPVTIAYQTMSITEKPDGLFVKILPDIYNRQTNAAEQLQQLFTPYAGRYTMLKEHIIPYNSQDNTAAEAKIAVLTMPAVKPKETQSAGPQQAGQKRKQKK